MGQEMSVQAQELISAVQAKDTKKVSELVEKMDPSQVNKLGEDRKAALHEACKEHNHAAVDILLKKRGIDVNVKETFGDTPLHVACFFNNPQTVKKLLARSDIKINARNILGCTPIMWAAWFCREEALKLLLGDPSVDLDTRCDKGKSLEEMVGSWDSKEGKKQKYLNMIYEERYRRENRQAEQIMEERNRRMEEKIKRESRQAGQQTENVEVGKKKGKETAIETENAGNSASPNVDNDVSLCWSCWREGQMYKCGACNRVTAYCSRECLQNDLPVHNNWCHVKK